MKYFLDLGTHKFEGLEEFKQKLSIDKTFHVHCFEPNKAIYDASRSDNERITGYEHEFLSFKHYNAAIMNYTGEIVFNSHKGAWMDSKKESYIDGYTTGSNCLDINPKYDQGNLVVFDIVVEKANCMDIMDIMSSIERDDPEADIYIKCDIEGSEFVVLPRLFEANNVRRVKKLYIEWHERFWYGTPEYTQKINERAAILSRCKQLGIETFVHT